VRFFITLFFFFFLLITPLVQAEKQTSLEKVLSRFSKTRLESLAALYERKNMLKEAAYSYKILADREKIFKRRVEFIQKAAYYFEKAGLEKEAIAIYRKIADYMIGSTNLQALACFKVGEYYYKHRKWKTAAKYLSYVVNLYQDKRFLDKALPMFQRAQKKSRSGFLAGLDYSIEKNIGQITKAAVEAQYKVLTNKEDTQKLKRVTKRLVKVAPRWDVKWSFNIIKADFWNAFAVPGGYIYVTNSLYNTVTEDELAGVLGHEIGHVVCRHSQKRLRRILLWNIAMNQINSKDTKTLLTIAAALKDLSYSRQNEYEADRYGVILAARAGYSPWGLPYFLKRIKEKYEKNRPSHLASLLRTHPITENRIKRATTLAKRLVEQNPTRYKFHSFEEYCKYMDELYKQEEKQKQEKKHQNQQEKSNSCKKSEQNQQS